MVLLHSQHKALCMFIDNKLTESLQAWLNTEPAERDFEAGALMMLKFNHNRILYQNAIRRPDKMMAKVEYELRKFLRMQLDEVTSNEVLKLDKELLPKVELTIAENAPVINADDDNSLPPTVAKGKRDDHDLLPDNIKALWDKNGEIYFKIKEVYNTLKTLEKALPCDRYEYLVQLKELDTQYHKNLADYDAFVITDDQSDGADDSDDSSNDAAEMFKKASAARTYISENKKKLEGLKQKRIEFAADEASLKDIDADYAKILAKVQKRYNWLVGNGLTVSDEQLDALKELGLIIS